MGPQSCHLWGLCTDSWPQNTQHKDTMDTWSHSSHTSWDVVVWVDCWKPDAAWTYNLHQFNSFQVLLCKQIVKKQNNHQFRLNSTCRTNSVKQTIRNFCPNRLCHVEMEKTENNAFGFPTTWPGWCQHREKPLSPIATKIMPKKQVWRHRMVSRRLTFHKPHTSVQHENTAAFQDVQMFWNLQIEQTYVEFVHARETRFAFDSSNKFIGKSTNESPKWQSQQQNVQRSWWTTNSRNSTLPKTESETMFGPKKLTSEIWWVATRWRCSVPQHAPVAQSNMEDF